MFYILYKGFINVIMKLSFKQNQSPITNLHMILLLKYSSNHNYVELSICSVSMQASGVLYTQ